MRGCCSRRELGSESVLKYRKRSGIASLCSRILKMGEKYHHERWGIGLDEIYYSHSAKDQHGVKILGIGLDEIYYSHSAKDVDAMSMNSIQPASGRRRNLFVRETREGA